jgi:GntR family histidine utilization transcriptional repressor
MATAQEAALLQIEPQAPCMVMVRRTMDHTRVITLARLVHPGHRYQLSGEFNP